MNAFPYTSGNYNGGARFYEQWLTGLYTPDQSVFRRGIFGVPSELRSGIGHPQDTPRKTKSHRNRASQTQAVLAWEYGSTSTENKHVSAGGDS